MKTKAVSTKNNPTHDSSFNDALGNPFNLNYTSVFSYFTNEVISECTPDKGFSTRIKTRLDAIKGVYGASSAFVAAFNKDTGNIEITLTDTDKRTHPDRFVGLDVRGLEDLREDTPAYFSFEGGGFFTATQRRLTI